MEEGIEGGGGGETGEWSAKRGKGRGGGGRWEDQYNSFPRSQKGIIFGEEVDSATSYT